MSRKAFDRMARVEPDSVPVRRSQAIPSPLPHPRRGTKMSDEDQIKLDRESLLSLKSLVDSMILCLRGMESRFRKEFEMIGAINALAEKASALIKKHLDGADIESR
jgi:hypothetical protein